MKRSNRNNFAFTLAEISVVIVVVAIAASILVAATGGDLRSSRLRLAANMMAADLEFCESQCINQPNTPTSVLFNTAGNMYSVVDRTTLLPITSPADGMPYTNDFATGRSEEMAGVQITAVTIGGAPAAGFSFDPYGKPLTTADVAITLNYNGSLMIVSVSSATGDVSIAAGN